MLLAHDVAGSGDAVVLLHSSMCDRRMFDPQWDALLAAGYRVLRVDFRGFGDTAAPTTPFDNADDVRAALDACGITQAAVVGASFGGRVASEFAARWPQRVTTLVLLCAARAAHPPTTDFAAFAEREEELLVAGKLDEAVTLNVETFLGPAADATTRDQVAQMQRHSFEVQLAAPDVAPVAVEYDLGAITARTLVVSGAHDLSYFTDIAEHLARVIRGARHVHLDWAGHLPSVEDPARFNPILLDFLTTS